MVIARNGLAACLLAGTLALATTAYAQGITDMKKGEGGSAVQGSAGTSGSQGAASDLEHCDKPMGALAVVEPQDHIAVALLRYKLGSPTGLIRLMVQQSNCFLVVERGAGMKNMMQERALADSGQLRQDSNVGGGQMVTADYIMTPAVVFSENNAGGVGGAGGGGGGAAALGGYSNTNEGKVIAASLADNYNGIVRAVRGNPSLQRDVGTLSQEAGARTKASDVFKEGDVVRPKIGNVKLLSQPSDIGEAVATLGKGEELIFMGKEQDGFLSVETTRGAGWVKRILVTR